MLASALGANRPDDSDPLTDDSGLTWAERRELAFMHGEPEPQFDDVPVSAQERAQMERLMSSAPAGMVPPNGLPAT